MKASIAMTAEMNTIGPAKLGKGNHSQVGLISWAHCLVGQKYLGTNPVQSYKKPTIAIKRLPNLYVGNVFGEK